MLTAESLLAMATEAEARYQQLRTQHPPGTLNAERNDEHDLAEKALVCAQWLEQRGGGPLAYVGPFGNLRLKRGDLVRIRRGAVMHSTHPSVPREGKPYLGTRPVKVFDIDRGYVTTQSAYGEEKVVQPRVHWAGAGGYWCWVDANDVELVQAV